MDSKINRRHFIKLMSGSAGAFVVGIYVNAEQTNNKTQSPVLDGLNPWALISIFPDNRIDIGILKQEIGQGTSTGVAMLLADEIGANWELISIHSVSLDYDMRQATKALWGEGVGGSGSISRAWTPMREAGAAIRMMFLSAAAKKWGVESANCKIENGIVHGADGRQLPLGELANAASKLEVPKSVELKPEHNLKVIGSSKANLYLHKHVTGSLPYAGDITLPNMGYAAIARCPVYQGKLNSFDAREVKKMPGVLDVFEIPGDAGTIQGTSSRGGVVVIADSTWRAYKARDALKIEWDFGELEDANLNSFQEEIKKHFAGERKKAGGWGESGNVDNAFASASEFVEGEYTSHYQEHALMEPMVAVAHYHKNTLELWAPVQEARSIAEAIERSVGIPQQKIIVHCCPAGGSFGRKYSRDYTNEAAYIATKFPHPIKLMWSREDCTQYGHYHPFIHFKIKASLDKNKRLSGILVDQYKASRPGEVWPVGLLYGIPNVSNLVSNLTMQVESGAWRSVVAHLNCFALESFIDEAAHRAGADPLQYRIDLLPKPEDVGDLRWRTIITRAHRVLHAVRDLSKWGSELPKGSAQGVALCEFNNTLSAQVATVRVVDGELHVDKVDCVTDSGRVLNPQMASGQIEGSVIWALSALQVGGIEVQDGRVVQSNFHDNPILRIDEIPEINVKLLESDGAIGGFGEPGVPPLAPAVLNAWYVASGKRIRTLPMRWEVSA